MQQLKKLQRESEKNSGFKGIQAQDVCDTVANALPNHLGYEAIGNGSWSYLRVLIFT